MFNPPTNAVRCVPFSQAAFVDEVRTASHMSPSVQAPPLQVQYLAAYLQDLGARTLVVESHYVDRHFVEETGLYYSRCLIQRPNSCVRIHAFTVLLTDADLDARVVLAVTEGARKVEEELEPGYLGYVVVRPIAAVPIGRTVLATLSGDPERRITATARYSAHLLGLRLGLTGLAFQQQDQAVAACATTAIWSALQRMARHEGARPPTPSAVTEAGAQHLIPAGRPYPSVGLTPLQMCDALRRFEFPPIVIAPGAKPDAFLATLNVYVRSGIPPILVLCLANGERHAVTVVGFRASHGPWPLLTIGTAAMRCVNRQYERIYLHDDRLGPYARATITKESPAAPAAPFVRLRIELPGGGHEDSVVETAVVPLYPKLRTNALELLGTAASMLPLMTQGFGLGAEPHVELFFDRSGSYSRLLYAQPIQAQRLAQFQRKIALSRYVGVARWYRNGTPLLDTVWDTTDTTRSDQHGESLLGIVGFDPAIAQTVDAVAHHLHAVPG